MEVKDKFKSKASTLRLVHMSGTQLVRIWEKEEQDDEKNLNTSEENKDLDFYYKKAVEACGQSGKFQKYLSALLLVTSFIGSLIVVALPLHKKLPQYYCIDKIDFLDLPKYKVYKNSPQFLIINDEHCVERYCKDIHPGFESAVLLTLVVDNYSEGNFITELKIMCSYDSFFNSYASLCFIGKMALPILLSYFTDFKGRKPAYFIELVCVILGLFGLLFFKNQYVVFIDSFLLMGFFHIYSIGSLVGSEFMERTLSNWHTGVNTAIFPVQGVIVVIMMLFLHSWNLVLSLNIVLGLGALFFAQKFFLETPVFLMHKKKYEELEYTMHVVAEQNGTVDQLEKAMKDLFKFKNDKITVSLQSEKLPLEEEKSFFSTVFEPYTLLFSTKSKVIEMIKLNIIFIVLNVLYYGLVIKLEKVGGNLYFNILLVYASEIVSEASAGPIIDTFGAKKSLLYAYISTVIYSLILMFTQDQLMISIFLVLFAISMGLIFATCFTYVFENFDAGSKSTCLTFLMNNGSIAVAFSPYIIDLFDNIFTLFFYMAMAATLTVIYLK